ncbi:HAD family hydrolase [Gemmobacter serpentinus]|uniref:HAD family hydrolase n=1 Tax=Gemmobacter serpentinus TaxID=2652247 RepID=UPI00124EC7A6|nr:HAD family phosphatase [Gemmobacter serpentinus]
MLPLPSALIFDCDGTLVLSADLHYRAFTETFAAQGLHLDRAFYLARGGFARRALIGAWIEDTGQAADIEALVQGSIDHAQRLAEAGACSPNPPVAALARAWGARPSAVASNGEWPVVTSSLRACQLDGLFDTVVTLDQVARAKPEPDMFLLAASRLNTAPQDCVVLEDSAEGIAAAGRAGMRALDVRKAEDLALITEWVAHLTQTP